MDKKAQHLYVAKKFCIPLNDEIFTKFSNLIKILSEISHPSIEKYHGYSLVDFNGKNLPVIVTEYCANGSLLDVHQKVKGGKKVKGWDYTRKMISTYGIASTMSYLHSLNILHRNLKLSSVHLDSSFNPKLSGFDLATFSDEKVTEPQGDSKYISPEVWNNEGYSKASDVYTFSILLYEIFTGKLAFENQNDHQIAYAITYLNKRPNFERKIPKGIQKLISSCWVHDPEKRPSFAQITKQLRSNPSFITKNIDKKQYHEYIQSLDKEKCENENAGIDSPFYSKYELKMPNDLTTEKIGQFCGQILDNLCFLHQIYQLMEVTILLKKNK